MKKIHEIRINYIDDENLRYIDAYFDNDPNSQGKTIAVVCEDTGKVIFMDNRYRMDAEIIDTIKRIKRNIQPNWFNLLNPMINEYVNNSDPLDGDAVELLVEILRLKINFNQGNITEDDYNQYMGETKYTILNLETNKTEIWTLDEILSYINDDRSNNWSDYDISDWREGWKSWVEPNGFYKLIQ